MKITCSLHTLEVSKSSKNLYCFAIQLADVLARFPRRNSWDPTVLGGHQTLPPKPPRDEDRAAAPGTGATETDMRLFQAHTWAQRLSVWASSTATAPYQSTVFNETLASRIKCLGKKYIFFSKNPNCLWFSITILNHRFLCLKGKQLWKYLNIKMFFFISPISVEKQNQ